MKRRTDCMAILLEKVGKNTFKKTKRRLLGFFVSATFNQFYTLDESGLAPTIILYTPKASLISVDFYSLSSNCYIKLERIADNSTGLLNEVFKLIRAYETDDMVELSLTPIPHKEVYKIE